MALPIDHPAPPPASPRRSPTCLLIGCTTLAVTMLCACLVVVVALRITGVEPVLALLRGDMGLSFGGGPGQGPLLFRDDFSNNRQGWGLPSTDRGEVRLGGGQLSLAVIGPNGLARTTATRVVDDFSLEIDSGLMTGPPETVYGVLFRYADEGNFYAFEVDASGQYRLGKTVNNVYTALIPPTASERVQPGQALNRLTVRMVGPAITISVNGVPLGSITDTSLASGRIGVTARLDPVGQGRVVFRNLEVRQTR